MKSGGKYFRQGTFVYGAIYTLWRGYGAVARRLSTWFYRRTVGACGPHSVFGRGVLMTYPRQIEIGAQCTIGTNVALLSESPSAELVIGDHVQVSDKVEIDFTGGVSIGSHSLISAGARVFSHDHGYDPRSEPVFSPLAVEEEVWIGYNAIVLPGVGSIGRGAVIGAGSVVTKPVEAGTVVAGNPARVITRQNERAGS